MFGEVGLLEQERGQSEAVVLLAQEGGQNNAIGQS